jgi:hypothetical protein
MSPLTFVRFLPLLLALLWPFSARAQQACLDLAGRVTASPLAGVKLTHVGEPRFVAVSSLLRDTSTAHVDVLDFATLAISQVTISGAVLLNRFGTWQASLGSTLPPDGELVWFGSGKSGLLLQDSLLTGSRRSMDASSSSKKRDRWGRA